MVKQQAIVSISGVDVSPISEPKYDRFTNQKVIRFFVSRGTSGWLNRNPLSRTQPLAPFAWFPSHEYTQVDGVRVAVKTRRREDAKRLANRS